jgi:hypothetical protein
MFFSIYSNREQTRLRYNKTHAAVRMMNGSRGDDIGINSFDAMRPFNNEFGFATEEHLPGRTRSARLNTAIVRTLRKYRCPSQSLRRIVLRVGLR